MMRNLIVVGLLLLSAPVQAKNCPKGPNYRQSVFDCLHRDCRKEFWAYASAGRGDTGDTSCFRMKVKSDRVGLIYFAKSRFGGPNVRILRIEERVGPGRWKDRSELIFPGREFTTAGGDVIVIPFGPTDWGFRKTEYRITVRRDGAKGVTIKMTDRISVGGQALFALFQQSVIKELGDIASRRLGRSLREGNEVFHWTTGAVFALLANGFDREITAAQLTAQFLAEYYGDEVAPREVRVFLATLIGNIYADVQKEINRIREQMADVDRRCQALSRVRRKRSAECNYHVFAGIPN